MNFDRRQALTTLLAAGVTAPAFGQTLTLGPAAPTSVERSDLRTLLDGVRNEFSLPGLSVTMAYKGTVLYEDAFGYAVKPGGGSAGSMLVSDNLFRIASLSKPITAVTVLDLIANPAGTPWPSIKLDSKVFGAGGLLQPDFAGLTFCDPRFADITVEQLLSHRSGCPTNDYFSLLFQNLPAGSGSCASDLTQPPGPFKTGDVAYTAVDPMFAQSWTSKSQHDLIVAVLQNMRLQSTPGTTYAYSNFGYLLLGRIIENCVARRLPQSYLDWRNANRGKIVGGGHYSGPLEKTPYAQVVQDRILSKIGITDMSIALPGQQPRPREVTYYSQYNGADPYAANVARMDSHGGWVATASDLARFAWAGVNLLDAKMKRIMTTIPGGLPAGAVSGYGLGWFVNVPYCNIFHGGYLTGSQAFMVRSSSDFTYAFLTNVNTQDIQTNPKLSQPTYCSKTSLSCESLGDRLDALGGDMISKVSSWQTQASLPVSSKMCPP